DLSRWLIAPGTGISPSRLMTCPRSSMRCSPTVVNGWVRSLAPPFPGSGSSRLPMPVIPRATSSNCSPGANRTPETTAWLRRPRSRSQGEGTLAGGVRTTIFDRHTTMDTAVQCVKRVHQLDLETLVYEREREQQSSRKHHISDIPHTVR